jgi:hypothetical protein
MLAAILALALSSAPVPRLMLHAELGASLPTRLLGELARAKAMDSIMGGAVSPGAAGLVPCTTAAGIGSWLGPTCWKSFLIDATGATTLQPSQIGWTNFATGNALQLVFGDLGSVIQGGYGDRVQLVAYHGIKVVGGRALTTQLGFEAGSGSADPSLTVVGNLSTVPALVVSGGQGLRVDGAGTGTPISASIRATFTESGTPAALSANLCTEVAVTVASSAVNAECIVGPPTVVPIGLIWGCRVSVAGTVQLRRCNITTASVTPTASAVWSVRVFNP